MRYVIPIDPDERVFEQLNDVFFFYEHGVKDALLMMLSTYNHAPELSSEPYFTAYTSILNDLDQWLIVAERTNTSIKGIENVYEITQFACEYLDQQLFGQLSTFFGDRPFEIISVTDLTPRSSHQLVYLITVNFDVPSPFGYA